MEQSSGTRTEGTEQRNRVSRNRAEGTEKRGKSKRGYHGDIEWGKVQRKQSEHEGQSRKLDHLM